MKPSAPGLIPSIPKNYHCQCPCPCNEPQPPPASTGDPLIRAGKSDPISSELTAFFPLGPDAHMTLSAPPKSGVSGSPRPVEFLRSSKPDSLGASPLVIRSLGSGEPDVGLRIFIPIGEYLW